MKIKKTINRMLCASLLTLGLSLKAADNSGYWDVAKSCIVHPLGSTLVVTAGFLSAIPIAKFLLPKSENKGLVLSRHLMKSIIQGAIKQHYINDAFVSQDSNKQFGASTNDGTSRVVQRRWEVPVFPLTFPNNGGYFTVRVNNNGLFTVRFVWHYETNKFEVTIKSSRSGIKRVYSRKIGNIRELNAISYELDEFLKAIYP